MKEENIKMKENRCVAYKTFLGCDREQEGLFYSRFVSLDTDHENCRERMYEVFRKFTKAYPDPVDFFAADFGARKEELPTGKDHMMGGLVVLVVSNNSVEQQMPMYNLTSGTNMEEIESKKNYKTNLTPYETVDEIKYSSDRFFLITTDDPRFPDQLIDTEQLDPKFRLNVLET